MSLLVFSLALDEEYDPCYSPQKALTLALTDWLQEFQSAAQSGGKVSKSQYICSSTVRFTVHS